MRLSIPPDMDEAIERRWSRLGAPGTRFTGEQRVAIVAAARGGATGDTIDESIADAARRIHDSPASITLEWLDGIRASGVTDAQYVEIVGVVAQVRAIDACEYGVGRPPRALPAPQGGEPSGEIVDGAALDGGWVPTVGPAYALNVLSLAPPEHDAMVDLSEAFYLAPRDGEGFTMGNQHVVRDGLTRSQIELVAARTSLINDCFY